MPEPKQLVVTWQDPDTRTYFPVGRLSRISENGNEAYRFVYVKGIEDARRRSFQPLLAFPEINETYESLDLFPFFANRLLPTGRQDRQDYVVSLGLNPDSAGPFEILARSGGRRTTDSVELFSVPELGSDGNYWAYFFLSHGLRHMPEFAQKQAERLTCGSRLWLMHDLQNGIDTNAIVLRADDYSPVGFMPRYLLADVWTLLRAKSNLQVAVERVNLPPAAIQQRILCRMQASPVEGFSPCSGDEYEPVSSVHELAKGIEIGSE